MRSDSILNAAASLLGVALLIVTAVHVTGRAVRSISDEVAFGSALLFIGSCFAAHLAIGKSSESYDAIAASLFFLALATLLFAMFGFWI
jgi:hypothetical protein